MAGLLRKRVAESGLDLPVTGSSMTGVIESGSTVSIVSARRPHRGQVWAFVDDNGRIIVHRIRSIEADTVTHRGVGNSHDDRPVERSRMIGRVISSNSYGRSRNFGTADAIVANITFGSRSLARRLGLRRRNRLN